MINEKLDQLCINFEDYLYKHFFDEDGILLSYIDKKTGKPFDFEYINTQKLWKIPCERLEEYHAYEDSMMNYGFYLTYLYEKYNATGDCKVLEQMKQTMEMIFKIYEISQQIENGFFGRPYGGLNRIVHNKEPLGTDQIAPLLSGVGLYRNIASDIEKRKIDQMVVDSLEWYRKQGYQYLWYKFFIHKYTDKNMSHALNFYLPCAYWAYNFTGDIKYYEDYKKFYEYIFYNLSKHEISFTFRFRYWLFWLAENTEDRVFWKDILRNVIRLDRKLFKNIREENEYYDAYLYYDYFLDEFNMFIADDGYSYKPSKDNPDGKKFVELKNLDTFGYISGYLRMVPSSVLANIAKYVMYTGENKEDISRVKEILAIHDSIERFTEIYLPEEVEIPESKTTPVRALASKHVIHWLIAYWRVKQIEKKDIG